MRSSGSRSHVKVEIGSLRSCSDADDVSSKGDEYLHIKRPEVGKGLYLIQSLLENEEKVSAPCISSHPGAQFQERGRL